MQSVTSNAVAGVTDALRTAINEKANGNLSVKYLYLTPRQLNTASTFTSIVASLDRPCLCLFTVGWEEYKSFAWAGSDGYIMITSGSAYAYGKLRNYSNSNWVRTFWWTDAIEANRYSGLVAI